jgi:hypothetical protein
MSEPTITHLERRKIEAGVLIPIVQAFQRAIGKERANEIARGVIMELARKDGERWAQQFGTDLAAMAQVISVWAGRGSLDPLIAYRTRAILINVWFASEKSHEFWPEGANRRSHRK